MKLLLDNCVPYRAKRLLKGHAVSHAKDEGWQRLGNGILLAAAAGAGFETLVTIDKKIKGQQDLAKLPLTVLEIDTPDSRYPELERLGPYIRDALLLCPKYRFVSVDQQGKIEGRFPR